MWLSESGARRWITVGANVGAAAAGVLGAWAAGFGLWALLVSPVAGTLGWFAGRTAAGLLGRRLTRLGYAPPGRDLYPLEALPHHEATAGGKALALARLTRAGLPVPAGVVLLPRAFDGGSLLAEPAAELARWLARRGDARYAVRSSALAEDAATSSFAGAYETVLDVPPSELTEAISHVRASASAERVAVYREALGVTETDLAVVVQELVPAEFAGVLFSVDPLSGDLSTMSGSAVAGLGESLVSGSQTGAAFTISRPDGAYHGPEGLRPHAAALAELGRRSEDCFGGAGQDIEWAFGDGRLWVLQSRPITTLSPWQPATAERNDSLAGTCLWSATNLSEANPEAQTPLTVSLASWQQAHGGPSMALRGREMAGSIGGRPYANLSVQITARRGKAAKVDPGQAYRALAGWWGDLPDGVPIPLIPMTSGDWAEAGLGLLGSLARMYLVRRHLPAFLRRHPADCRELCAAVEAAADAPTLAALWRDRMRRFGIDSFWAVIAAGSDAPARLEARLREEFGAEDAALLMSNMSGLADGLESLGPATGLQAVLTGELSRQQYLERFGHRGENELELAWPRPSEDPAWLDGALAGATDGAAVATLRERRQAAFDATLSRIRDRDPRRARRLLRQLRTVAAQAKLREAARSEGVRTVGVQRRFALRAGAVLGIGEDVFLLTVEELLASLDAGQCVIARFDARRAALTRLRSLPPLPGIIVGAFDPFAWASDPERRTDVFVAGIAVPSRPATDGTIRGHPGAAGTVEGVVRRLDDLSDVDQLRPGEILVTHLTNIGWTPAFPRAGGIVTDLGAPLSHAAIVARELGVPAVVGCGDATDRLRTGDRVLVDGARGEVRLIT